MYLVNNKRLLVPFHQEEKVADHFTQIRKRRDTALRVSEGKLHASCTDEYEQKKFKNEEPKRHHLILG